MTVPELKMNGWLPIPWAEYISKDASQGAHWNAGWEQGGTASTFTILINWQDGVAAEQAILGYSIFNPSSSSATLSRTLPVRHPYWSDQYAERIVSAVPVRWEGKAQFFSDNQFTSTTVPLSNYDFWIVTIGFAKPKYRIMSDSDLDNLYGAPRQEWRRFVEITVDSHIQTFSVEGFNWKWLDNGAGGGGAPTVGNVLTAPIGNDVYGAEWHVKWRRLPRLGLFANSGIDEQLNTNIISNYNKVHNGASNLWNMTGNASSGVLRFVSAKPVPLASPFDPLLQGLGNRDYNTYYDVDMVFSEWRPPYGNVTYQGWNIAPNPGDNLWYLVGTASTGAIRFQMADLTTVFKLSLT